MPGRLILTLVSSPWYGLLITMVTIPLMAVIGVAIVLLGSMSIWVAGFLALLSTVFQSVIYAQSARYAGSWTGLQRLSDQPTYFASVGRCLVVTIAVGLLSGLVTVAVLIVLIQFGGADEWWWMDRQKLAAAVQTAMSSPTEAEQLFSFENMNLSSLIFVIEIITMFFIMLIALFAVPRAVGLDRSYGRAYSPGLLLARAFIAFPFLVAMSGVLSSVALAAVQKAAGFVVQDMAFTAGILYALKLIVFTGTAFAFEAGLLRTAREHADEETGWALEAERAENMDFRAIRESWNQRS